MTCDRTFPFWKKDGVGLNLHSYAPGLIIMCSLSKRIKWMFYEEPCASTRFLRTYRTSFSESDIEFGIICVVANTILVSIGLIQEGYLRATRKSFYRSFEGGTSNTPCARSDSGCSPQANSLCTSYFLSSIAPINDWTATAKQAYSRIPIDRNPKPLLLYIKHSLSRVTCYVEMPRERHTLKNALMYSTRVKSKGKIPA
jgi:hypothetical protein